MTLAATVKYSMPGSGGSDVRADASLAVGEDGEASRGRAYPPQHAGRGLRRSLRHPVAYEDLFDIEKRPGAGVGLWTRAVALQLERVREANYAHRLHNGPSEKEQQYDPDAESRLHADVYFLALSIRRLLLFHDVLAKHLQDPRLHQVRAKFDASAPRAKELRDFYEHLDEYLLDSPRKHVKFVGRSAPMLQLRWDCDNVVVSFGERELDITVAAVAAIELGRESEALWVEHLERIKRENPSPGPPPVDDGIERVLAVTMGVSTTIGGEDEGHMKHTGVLLGVEVREGSWAAHG